MDNLESARNAIAGGAIRLELCTSLNDGGLTPSLGLTKAVVALARPKDVKVHVLIRTRPGDFCYNADEVDVMACDAGILISDGGADGVVLGCLDVEGNIDQDGCKTILKSLPSSKIVSKTFHRAFDVTRDPHQSAKVIAEMGFDRVLTSGQQLTALEGKTLLRYLSRDFKGKLEILPGGGISETNLKELSSYLLEDDVKQFHASAKVKKYSKVKFQNDKCKMGPNSEDYCYYVACPERVGKMAAILKSF